VARIQRLLIANRGEIACRIARSARALGMEVIAVYSDADAGAAHVRGADRALRLGPAPARASYLDVAALMACARAAGADAIHPGYGFLSESAALAAACAAEGRVFVGPPLQALQVMGSKAEAKRRMALAHVPLTPGYHGEDQSLEVMRAQAEALGYPLLVKASAGGGGRGMRRVDGPDGLAPALAACRREALGAFGDGRLLLERLLVPARHIEVQVFGDAHGALVHLFDRDCSLQRRHQKVIEEAPAPQLAPALRARMAGAALAAARAVGYVGAGTVEFLLPVRAGPEAPEFCFMEMNTRLQVEHTVTEAITGLDLVEWQLRVAQGEPLPLEQAQIQASGHAFQARLYAEDPARGFLPSPGVLQELQVPDGEGLRWDGGFEAGDRIAGEYDALLGKLVAWGPDRESARARLGQALARLQVSGPVTNHALLARLLDHPLVRQPAGADTGLLDRELEPLCAPDDDERDAHRIALLVEYLLAAGTVERACPWADGNGWRLNQAAGRRMGRAPAPLAPAQAPVWIGPARRSVRK
jgi:3-methylcrotonyl-CoA carboxylase alpha subunit